MKKDIIQAIKIIILALVLSVGVNYAFAAWTAPSLPPTEGNVAAPLNVGPTSQVKGAGLSLDALAVFGTAYVSNNVGVGTVSPEAQLHVKNVDQAAAKADIADVIIEDLSAALQIIGGSGDSHLLFSDEDGIHWSLNHWGSAGNNSFSIGYKVATTNNWAFGGNTNWNNYLTIESDGQVGIGDFTPDAGLKLDVEGKVGATEYCDQNGLNCVSAASIATCSSIPTQISNESASSVLLQNAYAGCMAMNTGGEEKCWRLPSTHDLEYVYWHDILYPGSKIVSNVGSQALIWSSDVSSVNSDAITFPRQVVYKLADGTMFTTVTGTRTSSTYKYRCVK
ncbi:hypothetical protein A2442_00990 [Candidatus Campbellbacteria bacterium RIFOXYC2_FULL_35_25]|uniref:DUF1566 domain-containing protein n=1 Tax=Candidatus Campbellbacteria bacterium RIFOXYC2_FULL_35_25 TaxID=1797582 RepID=A0A1F5EIX3_9BACT|nr:MAG: hypothetical protein A2442_00990 [Candidatus Campbellbacteria bacterium RIFOXYC2_FULL_35_25]